MAAWSGKSVQLGISAAFKSTGRTFRAKEVVESDREDVDDRTEVLAFPVPPADGVVVGVPVVEVGQGARRGQDSGEMDDVVEGNRHSSYRGQRGDKSQERAREGREGREKTHLQ